MSLYLKQWEPGPRFTNVFSIAIQIRRKFCFTLTSILIWWSLQKFVHVTTAVLSWHVPIFVAIWWPATKLQQDEVAIEFELRAKTVSETGSWVPFQYKDCLCRYLDSHCKDWMLVRPLYNGNSNTSQLESLYWDITGLWPAHWCIAQGSFWVWTQPMRGGITK